jgi:plastocyanin
MTMTFRWRRALLLLFTLAVLPALVSAAACGGDDDDNGDDGGDGTPAGNGDGGEVTFDVSMGDNFYEPNEFTVDPGTTITFNLTNDGTAIHNMRVAGADNEYNTDDDAVSDPDLFLAGDAGTLVWTAPEESGTYDFQCDFHLTDMLGTITVE